MKQVLKRLGQSVVSAIKKEVLQMVTMDALDPDDPKKLSREDCRSAMAYLLFLDEKWDGTIKAQGCCNGRVQYNYMIKEETSSPPVIQEIMMVTCDDMSNKQVRTEVPVDGQTVSKYSFVSRTVDLAAARKSLFYH